MDDMIRAGIVVGLMAILLAVGLVFRPADTSPVPVSTEVASTTVVAQKSIEMLDPCHSEKAVFEDDVIRISFEASQTADGVESQLPFWLHNRSDQTVVVLWDRCSIQLPACDTVNVLHEEDLVFGVGMPDKTISVAPGGDLFNVAYPCSEVTWSDGTSSDAGTFDVSTGVLDQGPFLFVLAVECGSPGGAPCDGGREIRYYPFRFVIR
jgi:hypothetical protein